MDILKTAMEIVSNDYPEFEINIARDSGEEVIIFLYDPKCMVANSIIASYSIWDRVIRYFKFSEVY